MSTIALKKNTIVLNSKKELLMQSLIRYFNDEKKLNKFLPIVNGKSNISLRLIDWFVTNYSKKNGTSYEIIWMVKKYML